MIALERFAKQLSFSCDKNICSVNNNSKLPLRRALSIQGCPFALVNWRRNKTPGEKLQLRKLLDSYDRL